MTTDQTEDEQDHDFVAALFGTAEPAEPDDKPDKLSGNYVPKEGNTPKPPRDDGMREFTRALFGDDLNA